MPSGQFDCKILMQRSRVNCIAASLIFLKGDPKNTEMLKENIYRELTEIQGKIISGQELADAHDVSRTAVWKAVRSLQEEGYPVESVGKKGYRIAPGSDVLTADGIRAYLDDPNALRLCLYRRLDSTNAQAERMIADGFHGSALIASEEQTRGRGHHQSAFDSPAAAGLYMTLLLPLRVPFSEVADLGRRAGQTVLSSIRTFSDHDFHIEKISDIYDGDQKISGVLCEIFATDLESGCTDMVIAGIGIHLDTLKNAVTRDRLAAVVTNQLLASFKARFCSPA